VDCTLAHGSTVAALQVLVRYMPLRFLAALMTRSEDQWGSAAPASNDAGWGAATAAADDAGWGESAPAAAAGGASWDAAPPAAESAGWGAPAPAAAAAAASSAPKGPAPVSFASLLKDKVCLQRRAMHVCSTPLCASMCIPVSRGAMCAC
jgi:hypothetical protein